MGQQLTNLEITRVSLVDKGANQRRLAVLKRNEEDPMTQLAAAGDTTPSGIAAWLHKAADALLGRKVAKTLTFADIVAGQELSDALYDSWSTLQDALWSAIYAYDEQGQALSLEAKTALVAQNLDEYKAYLLAQMAGVSKRADGLAEAPSRHIAAIVAKVGRKISGSRLERLQQAAEALTGVLAEVVEETSTEADDAEEEPVEKAEIAAMVAEAVTKAQEPLLAEIAELKKSAAAAPAGDGTEGKPEGDDAPVTLDTIAEALGTIADRVGKLEGPGTGSRTSIAGQDGADKVAKKSTWAGAF